MSVSHAEEDLKFLRKQKSGEISTTLRGYVCLAKGVECEKLPDVEIRILGGDVSRTVVPDASGSFEFSDLNPGKYVGQAQKKGYIPSEDPYHFEVFQGACNSLGVHMGPDTQVSGRVVDMWGSPAEGVKVQIDGGTEPVTTVHPFPTQMVTDSAGKFVFRGIQPEEYKVGVNTDLLEAPSPFPATYYPGVRNESEATVVKVGWGQHIDNVDFQLPHRLRTRRLDVRVMWSDGSPAVGAGLSSSYGRADCQYFGLPSRGRTDAEGRISMEIFKEGCYSLHTVFVDMGPQGRVGESKRVEIRPGDEPVKVELVLTPHR